MELDDSFFTEEDIVDQCDQIRAIASKNWLSSAYVSLAQLDQVKASVYNVGLVDKKDLKATNLENGKGPGVRSQSFQDLSNPSGPTTTPPLNTVSYQKTAWGSNNSIPDLLRQHGGHSGVIHPQRPESAKTASRRHCPSSGKKPRPESAKSSKESSLPARHPKIAVKGAKYDPAGRPPKQAPHQSVTTGWVGPPAGMKYPDPETEQALSMPTSHISATPPPPTGTPVPKLNLEVDIQGGTAVSDRDENSESEQVVEFKYSHGDLQRGDKSSKLLRKPVPEEIHLSLPTMFNNEEDDSDLDTERLIHKANAYSLGVDNTDVTNDNSINSQNEESTGDHTNHTFMKGEFNNSFESHSKEMELESSDDDWSTDEHFQEPHQPLGKVSVTFLEDKNVTIDITPRNQGHKVSQEMPACRKKTVRDKKDRFTVVADRADLEMQLNSTLSVSGASHVTNNLAKQSKHNKSKMKSSIPVAEMFSNTEEPLPKGKSSILKQRPNSAAVLGAKNPESCEKHKARDRPSSASIHKSTNRQERPVTMVMVDFGDDGDNEKKNKCVKKKSRNKDVVSLVEQLSVTDGEENNDEDEDDDIEVEVDITPDLLRPGSPTKLVSEPVKNYYEISRQAGTRPFSAVEKITEKVQENPVIKTTKTIELDKEKGLRETTVKSVVDTQLLNIKEVVPHHIPHFKGGDNSNKSGLGRGKPVSRPNSAKVNGKPPLGHEISRDEGRPGSRLGFIAMAPETPLENAGKQGSRRPVSAGLKHCDKTPETVIESSDNLPENKAQNTENCENNDRPTPVERMNKMEELMNKHLKRTVISETPSYMSTLSSSEQNQTKTANPSAMDTRSNCESTPLKISATKIDSPVVLTPRKQREKDIDSLIQKHLKRPPSTFTASPLTSARSSAQSISSPVSTPKSVNSAAAELKLKLTSAAQQKKKLRKSGIQSPKSTLVSEQHLKNSQYPEDHVFVSDTQPTFEARDGGLSGVISDGHDCKAHSHSNASIATTKPYTSQLRSKSAPVRMKSAASKIHYTKPMFITTKRQCDDMDTMESENCVVMQAKLASKGVNISAKTLERALYPPSGQTTYYEINAHLPKTPSHGLLSHPRTWLPDEYRQLKSAEKALAKVNEILYLQKKAEIRKAKAAEGGTTAVTKKKKKSGKKKGSALRRSKTPLS